MKSSKKCCIVISSFICIAILTTIIIISIIFANFDKKYKEYKECKCYLENNTTISDNLEIKIKGNCDGIEYYIYPKIYNIQKKDLKNIKETRCKINEENKDVIFYDEYKDNREFLMFQIVLWPLAVFGVLVLFGLEIIKKVKNKELVREIKNNVELFTR